jgi:sucrose synthase
MTCNCFPVLADAISRNFRQLAIASLCLQAPYSEISDDLQLLGFEPGWGNTIARAKDTMNLALNLLEAPDSVRLFDFLSRMPNMFNVVILSPHGFFGQKDVLGKPDTGGQVGLLLHAMPFVYVDCH